MHINENNIKINNNKIKNSEIKINTNKTDDKIRINNNNEINVNIANTFIKRLIGLMFKKESKIPLVFEIPKSNMKSRSSIHTCFMRFEITVIFIDWEEKVFEIKDLKPWKYHKPKKPAKYVIEIEKENLNKYNLKKGDKISLHLHQESLKEN